jgi:hypothetical protein
MKKRPLSATVILLCLVLLAGTSLTQEQPPAEAEQAPDEPPVIENVDLQALIDRAEDGDTITISTGTYVIEDGLVISGREGLTILCESPVNVFCRDTNDDVLTIMSSSGITLAGGRLRHLEPLDEYICHGGVVRVAEASDVLVYRCELDGCGAIGASIRSSQNVHIHQCHVHDNSFAAFYIDDSDEVKITDCRIVDNMTMLANYARGDQSLEMWGNTITNNTGYWEQTRDEIIRFELLDRQIAPSTDVTE